MVAFSRLQLATALIEYDNDPDNPNAPYKSALDSAIFAPMRRAAGARRPSEVKNSDFLGVSLPSDAGVSQDPTLTRKSMVSVDLMQNPFSAEDEGEEVEEEVPEVDLASWGLDTFVPKEKGSKASKGKGKAKSEIVLADQNRLSTALDRSQLHARANSEFGVGEAFLEDGSRTPGVPGSRRNSLGNALADGSGDEYERPRARRRQSAHNMIENMAVLTPLHASSNLPERDSIPFPSSSPVPEDNRPSSRNDTLAQGHTRTYSTATMGTLATKNELQDDKNLFSVPLPPPSMASRFDPKVQEHMRTLSNATVLTGGFNAAHDTEPHNSGSQPGDEFAPRSKRLSAASYGTRQMLDNMSTLSGDGYDRRERGYSRMELMRPKVLIMPSPLQNPASAESQLEKPTRPGFIDSSDGRPMPPGARTSRTMSMMFPPAGAVPVASNSFTPNPRLNLSASQLLFRNTLLVDGQRDVTYNDIDSHVRRANKEGEQVKQEFQEEEKPEPPPPPPPVIVAPPEEVKPGRPPGKLFGRSLIDDLEARKAEMRSKQRVFTGDQRPSMMDRSKTASTLIDPASLQRRPASQLLGPQDANDGGLTRRGSRGSKPLLAFDDDGQLAETRIRDGQMPKTKSVFGVDLLWEREMEKLKLIEEEERKEAEERARLEQLEESTGKGKHKKGKNRKKDVEEPVADALVITPTEQSSISRHSSLPHVLPDIPSTLPRRRPTQPSAQDESDDESSASEADVGGKSNSLKGRDKEADKWVADEDDISPVRTTGVGPRYPSRLKVDTTASPADDSDEDIPLSVAAARASQLLTPGGRRLVADDDEDEDRPLSTLLDKPKSSILAIDFDKPTSPTRSPGSHLNVPAVNQGGNSDDDDVPLGIRASKVLSSSQISRSAHTGEGDDDDDDRPLGMHPEAQRKSQFNMLAQQQQLMQAQFQSAMSLAPSQSFVGAPFTPFGPVPPMAPMMMMAPQPPMLQQLQAQDAAKFGRVDKWRHDVALEGT